jgi:hypothetical protein
MGSGRELDVAAIQRYAPPLSQVSLPSGHVMAARRFRPPHGPLRFPVRRAWPIAKTKLKHPTLLIAMRQLLEMG